MVDEESERGVTAGATPLVRRVVVLLLVPAVIGVATGACVSAASLLVEDKALAMLASLPGSLPAIPSLVGLLLTLLVVRYVTRVPRPATAEVYILAFHDPRARISLRELPGRILAAAVTVASGGSQGLESPSALIGASFGQLGGDRLPRITAVEQRTWMIAGAGAGIAAVFSSPGVGAMYGMEVPFRRDLDAPRLVPAVVAAGASYLTREYLIGTRQLALLDGTPTIDGAFALGCLLVAMGCGVGARLFAIATEQIHHVQPKLAPWLRATIGGVVLASLAFSAHTLTGAWLTFGPGYYAADWIAGGEHAIWLLAAAMVIRTAGTLVCVFGGGGGGVFTSLAVTGVFVGQIVAELLGHTASNVFPILGAACFLGAGYRIPLGGMLLVAESTGDMILSVAGLTTVAIAQVLMGDHSVSDAKREARRDLLSSHDSGPARLSSGAAKADDGVMDVRRASEPPPANRG